MTASYSEVSSFLDCRRRHHYSYIEELQPITESVAIRDGKIAHTVLATYYDARKEGFTEDEAVIAAGVTFLESGYVFDSTGKRADLNVMLFEYYFPNEPYISQGYEVLAVEREFVLRWDDGEDEGYKFIIDLILRDKSGQVLIVDHKFTGRFTTEDMGQMLPQIPLYIGALRAQGLPAHYGEYNEINMTKVVKKRTVAEALHRLPFVPTPERVAETFRQQVEVAREIQARKSLTVSESASTAWRSIDKIKCGMCSFQSICVGELNGSNTQIVRNTNYKRKEKKVFANG